ncbi:hypothetical protein PR202_ga07032 [Eleusine coracana subsp. coracana]|uniref:Potassium channel n=1 Tax=Eleusine coracana subsp. coracana TaxID=191504 RepID=A0AAV5BYK4_ELECO|nr:hypothetical protein PR202_ga07032 [Eleusine coracana subsp. coracana]
MTRAHSNSCLKQFWDGVQDKRNNSNFTVELLPSLGATINHSNKLKKFTISPYDPRYRCWELFLIVLVVYSAWICPLELAFLRDLPSKLLLVENIANGFFAIDIVLTFFVAYVDSKTHILVDDRKRIAVRLEKDIRFNYFWIRCSKLISVTEVQAEYFPPEEDIMLQNEGAADIYLVVSGAVNMITTVNGDEQVYGRIAEGGMFGEVGVLCDVPQPFTCRTTKLSQLLRISKTRLTEIMHEHREDSNILMNNLYQKLKQQGSLPDWNQPAPRFMANNYSNPHDM